MSLFDKYGGFATINKIVFNLYQDMNAHPTLSGYFEGIDMSRLIDHQTKFISQALGGPAAYSGRTLALGHQGLNISDEDFNEVAQLLRDNLEDAGMEEGDVEEVMTIVEGLRGVIVGQ